MKASPVIHAGSDRPARKKSSDDDIARLRAKPIPITQMKKMNIRVRSMGLRSIRRLVVASWASSDIVPPDRDTTDPVGLPNVRRRPEPFGGLEYDGTDSVLEHGPPHISH